jgi:hypothetical protein
MATIPYTAERIGERSVSVRWSPLTFSGTDDGVAFSLMPGADRSVHVSGTFGASGSLTLEGSNQATPATWVGLTDPQGNALTFTSARIEQIAEYTRWIRPRVTAGDGTTSLVVDMIAGG